MKRTLLAEKTTTTKMKVTVTLPRTQPQGQATALLGVVAKAAPAAVMRAATIPTTVHLMTESAVRMKATATMKP